MIRTRFSSSLRYNFHLYGKNRCDSSLNTLFTPNKTPALPKIPAMTSAVVLNAPPTLGHSIKPTSSAAPAKMFAPSSALASFAARIAAPISSADDDDVTSVDAPLVDASSDAPLSPLSSPLVPSVTPSPSLARRTTTTRRARNPRDDDDDDNDDARNVATRVDVDGLVDNAKDMTREVGSAACVRRRCVKRLRFRLRFSSGWIWIKAKALTLLYKQIKTRRYRLVREGNGGEPKPEEIAKRGVGGVHRGLVTHEDVDGDGGGGQSGAEKRQGVESGEDG